MKLIEDLFDDIEDPETNAKYEEGDEIFQNGYITSINKNNATIDCIHSDADIIFNIDKHLPELEKLVYLNNIKNIYVDYLGIKSDKSNELKLYNVKPTFISRDENCMIYFSSNNKLNIENISFKTNHILTQGKIIFNNCNFDCYSSLNIKADINIPEFINCKFESKNVVLTIPVREEIWERFANLIRQLVRKEPLDIDIPNDNWNPIEYIYDCYGIKNYPTTLSQLDVWGPDSHYQTMFFQYKPKSRKYGMVTIKNTGWVVSIDKRRISGIHKKIL